MYLDQLWWLGSNSLAFCQYVPWIMDWISEILPTEFSTALITISSLLHHIMHLDPLPDHPKSSIGCI
jgi:hypothetical protein